jgi:hypothetical protein
MVVLFLYLKSAARSLQPENSAAAAGTAASVTASQFEVFQCHCVVEGCSVEGDHWDADEEEEVVF